jgi:hypothetical protein
MDTKWIARSRQVWQWILVALFAIAALDALTVDAILPHIGTLFDLEPPTVLAIRAKLLALAPVVALALKLWRVSRPDERSLTVIPAPIRDRLP